LLPQNRASFQTLDDGEVGEHAECGLGRRLSIRAKPDGWDALRARGIGGSDLRPRLAVTGSEIQSEKFEWDAATRHQQALAVSGKANGKFFGAQSYVELPWTPASQRVEPDLAFHVDSKKVLAVSCNESTRSALRSHGAWRATLNI
jgi:hypothetical protein